MPSATTFAFTAMIYSAPAVDWRDPGADQLSEKVLLEAEAALQGSGWRVDGRVGYTEVGEVIIDVSTGFSDDAFFDEDSESSLEAQAENFALDTLTKAVGDRFTIAGETVVAEQ